MIVFPVYVRDDAGDVIVFASIEMMQSYLEAIDVENGEYEAWDAAGYLLELGVGEARSEWLKITQSDRALNQDEFAEIKGRGGYLSQTRTST